MKSGKRRASSWLAKDEFPSLRLAVHAISEAKREGLTDADALVCRPGKRIGARQETHLVWTSCTSEDPEECYGPGSEATKMSPSTVMDVVIGLSFVYLLLSLFCSALNEAVAAVLALRQASLRRGIEVIVRSPALQQMIYNHPLIVGLSHGTWWRKLPSYIPADIFAAALQDILSKAEGDQVPNVPEWFLPADNERSRSGER